MQDKKRVRHLTKLHGLNLKTNFVDLFNYITAQVILMLSLVLYRTYLRSDLQRSFSFSSPSLVCGTQGSSRNTKGV